MRTYEVLDSLVHPTSRAYSFYHFISYFLVKEYYETSTHDKSLDLASRMGILTQFTSPQDVRWQAHRNHHIIFLVKSILLIPFIIVVIVEYSLFKDWWENGPDHTRYDWEWAPYDISSSLISLY